MDENSHGGSSSSLPPFLTKTYEMVDDSSSNSVVSWSQSNKSFIVWNPSEFSRDLLPRFFKHNNFSSFMRQLNTYPGPRDATMQCFIKRDKSNLSYHLYLCLSPALLVENGKFLLSVKHIRRTTYTEYVISMHADTISRSSNTYIGKIRSNFLGTKFVIYDKLPTLLSFCSSVFIHYS